MFGRLGPMELVLILIIALVVFGPSKLPDVGEAFGKAIRKFKDSANEVKKEADISEELSLDDEDKK
ncbi:MULTISPECIES: twin-arginine translocase TatA/TatE family subunit [unclassified Halanaerobium]|uniref:Sec-independent protein translocase subunit TatA/TatB n=1 Tax=unclassified Halanaerobium TaxID=2641197 RepID=UPI000DF1DE1E|nr:MULTISPECIES: twin-arginine translocase TatA/TatE family subunit [unclassified Halanaerobium]RCW40617.1 Sec-independent protein translocase TatA [Halanaerobium sp. MA284_MarDTE_T2]RCW87991.1 Sec-independent protein translocase TatA [Halanaerobium sp. DL-01]